MQHLMIILQWMTAAAWLHRRVSRCVLFQICLTILVDDGLVQRIFNNAAQLGHPSFNSDHLGVFEPDTKPYEAYP